MPVTPLNPFLLLYLIFTLSAYLISPLPQHSLPHLIFVGGGVAAFLAAYAWLQSDERLTGLLHSVILAGGLLALTGLLAVEWPAQYLFDFRPLLDRLPRLATFTFLHPNELAGLLLLLLPLTWKLRPTASTAWLRRPLYLAAGLMLLMLLLLQSRNAWLGLLVAGVVYRWWGRFSFAYLALPLAVLLLFPFTLNLWPEPALARLERSAAFLDDATKSGEATEPSWLSRLEIWRVAGQMIADYPLLGAGLYTFDPLSRANYAYAIVAPEFPLTHSHNWFLQTATSLGIPGLLLLAAMWAVILWRLWGRRATAAGDNGLPTCPEPDQRVNTDEHRLWGTSAGHWRAAVGAALVGCLWFNFFDMLAWEQRGGLLLWLLLAVAVRLSTVTAGPVGQDGRRPR